ncbi:MAG: hypothetical protein WD294_01230 [Phycisphaeraceae bacterium]
MRRKYKLFTTVLVAALLLVIAVVWSDLVKPAMFWSETDKQGLFVPVSRIQHRTATEDGHTLLVDPNLNLAVIIEERDGAMIPSWKRFDSSYSRAIFDVPYSGGMQRVVLPRQSNVLVMIRKDGTHDMYAIQEKQAIRMHEYVRRGNDLRDIPNEISELSIPIQTELQSLDILRHYE